MKQEDISTFLAIVETRSISKAAEKLFLSQAAVSQRLKALEKEVGMTLIERHKGFKTVDLTPYGNQFIDIAERWSALCQETEEMKNKTGRLSMTIACNDSLATYMPLFKYIAESEKGIDLDIRTLESEDAFDLIERREADAGLILNVISSAQVNVTPILIEDYVIVSRDILSDKDIVSADDMDPEKEIVLAWGREYLRWRETLKIHPYSPHVRVNRMSMIPDFLEEEGTWAIVPETVAVHYSSSSCPLNIYKLAGDPPRRESCLVVHHTPRTTQQEAISIFKYHLNNYLKTIKK